jgi:hypothetical protein
MGRMNDSDYKEFTFFLHECLAAPPVRLEINTQSALEFPNRMKE